MTTSIDDHKAAHHALPNHVAIIMDGNNRWAKKRFMPGVAGHKAGVSAVQAVVDHSARIGIKTLTLFAFSSENWRRPEREVNALMKLFVAALKREVKKLHENDICLRVIGDKSGFNDEIQNLITNAEVLTQSNKRMTLVVAANYGGQWDITQATKKVCQAVLKGDIDPEQIDENLLHGYTELSDLPAPDLMIRTGGEQRISNFMLWQTAYSEMYFSDALWPDFKKAEYQKALDAFIHRTRRFGRTDDQLTEEGSRV